MRPGKRALGFGLLAVLVAGFLALMAVALLNKEPVTGKSGFTRIDKPAPDITLPLFDGGEIVLSQHKEGPAVINFWASWCAPCRTEAAALEGAWRTYGARDVLFLGVDIQDTDAEGVAHLREFGVTYPNGPDRDGTVTVDYGVIGLPVTFFVGKDGIVKRRWVGAINGPQLATWVEEILDGAPVSGEAEGESPEGFFKLDQRD